MFTTRLPLFLSRFLFSRKLFTKTISSLYYKTTSNKNKILQGTFFPYCINKCNKLKVLKGLGILNQLPSLRNVWCEKKENSLFCIYSPLTVKLFIRLRLQFSHLNEHKFRRGFSDTINPMFACRTGYFLLHCQFYRTQRLELFENLENVECNV